MARRIKIRHRHAAKGDSLDRDIIIARGDTGAVPFYVVDELGRKVDLTGCTVKLYGLTVGTYYGRNWAWDRYSDFGGLNTPDTPKINGVTVTPDADQVTNKGLCSWTPSATDSDTAGDYAVQVKVTNGNGQVRHYPSALGARMLFVGASSG